MNLIVKNITALGLALCLSTPAWASDMGENQITLKDLNYNIELSTADMLVAANNSTAYRSSVPNIPDSAFEKPAFTENNLHMYLGLASLAMGGLAGITAPDSADPDLLNSVHFKAAKLSWQLGAAAVGTGFYTHWDDFHIEDGLFDRDNLHILLGLAGTIGYYLAVKGAVDEYNDIGYPSSDHASKGIFGGAAMITAIAVTW
ncbi:MAG: hypothetical protein R8M46_05565 [Ghiorsea sp.]